MGQLREQLKKTLSAELPNIQSQLQPVKQILDQYGNAFTTGSQKAQTAAKQTGDKIKQTAQVTQQAADAVKKTLSAMSDPLKNVNAQLDVQRQKLAALQDKYAAVASSKGTNSTQALNLQNQMLRVGETIDRLQEKANSMGASEKSEAETAKSGTDSENASLDEEAKRLENITRIVKEQAAAKARAAETESVGMDINASPGYPKAHFKTAAEIYAEQQGTSAGNASATEPPQLTGWERFKAQFYAKLDEIKAKLNEAGLYGGKKNLFGGETSAWDKIKSSLKGITAQTDTATVATKKWGKEAESSSNRATNGFSRTNGMIGRMLIRMAVWKTVRAVFESVKTGINDMAQGVSSANITMSQLATSMLYLKNSIGAALMPVINALAPAITWLTDKIAGLFNMLGMLNARIFGGSSTVTVARQAQVNYAETLGKSGDAAEKAAEREEKAAEKAKKAREKANQSVLSFDKLNKLDAPKEPDSTSNTTPQLDAGAGMPSFGSMFTTEKIPSSISAIGDKIKAELAKWAQYAQPTVAAFQRLVKSMEPLKTFVAKGAEDFYKDFLVPVGKWVLGKGLPDFMDTIAKFNKDVHWDKINKALDDLWKALTPFAIHVGEGLDWFFKNVLEPVGAWTMNEVVPLFLKILANAIKIVDNVIVALEPLGKWLFDNFLKPLAEWTGGVIVTILKGIADGLGKIGDWIKTHQEAVQVIAVIIGSFAAAWGLVNAAIAIWNVIGAVATGVTTAFGAAVAFLTSPIGIVVIAIGALIAIIVLLKQHWGEVEKAGGKAWDWIKDKWNGAGDWFKGVFSKIQSAFKPNMISDAFGKAWQWVQDKWKGAGSWFEGIWESIKSKFKPDMITDGFKKAWNALTSFKFKLPKITWSGDGPEAFEPVKTILHTLQLPTQLPKLNITWNANGGVYDSKSIIGVGEYAGASSNPEIVSPQKVMYNTVVEANGKAVSAIAGLIYDLIDAVRESGGGDIYLDGEKLSKNTISHINSAIRRTGKNPILA